MSNDEEIIVNMNIGEEDLSYLEKNIPTPQKNPKKRTTKESKETDDETPKITDVSRFQFPKDPESLVVATRIKKYIDHKEFGSLAMDNVDSLDLSDKSKEDLEEIEERIKFSISSKRSSGSTKGMITVFLTIWESLLLKYTPIKATGISTLLSPYSIDEQNSSKDSFPSVCDELAIENDKVLYSSAAFRAGQMVLQGTMQLHMFNKNKDREGETPKKTQEEFNDI